MSINHSQENSLTHPNDRSKDPNVRWRPDLSIPPLEPEEAKNAFAELIKPDCLKLFQQVDRNYIDPPLPMQMFALISFTPSLGATPDENGIFGFSKVRGTFSNLLEAEQHAQNIIKNVDSCHSIYYAIVGRPFPITSESKFSYVIDEVDLRKETVKTISGNIKKQEKEEEKLIQELHDREAELKADVAEGEDDPYDVYCTLKTKKAQLTWTYFRHGEKMKEIAPLVVKSRLQLEELDEKFPEFQYNFLDKIRVARESVGLTDEKLTDENHMRIMVEDISCLELDELYEEIIKSEEPFNPPPVQSSITQAFPSE